MSESFSQLFCSTSTRTPLQQERLEVVRLAVEKLLTPAQREAVVMHFFLGLSQSEIARRIGVSQQVVYKRIYGVKRNGRSIGGALRKLKRSLCTAS